MAVCTVLPPADPTTLFAYGIDWVCFSSNDPSPSPVQVQGTDLIDETWKALQQTSKTQLQPKHLTRLFKMFPRDVAVDHCGVHIVDSKLYLLCGTKQWIWMRCSTTWKWVPQKDLSKESSVPETVGLIKEMRDAINKRGLTPNNAHATWMLQKLPPDIDLCKSHVTSDDDQKTSILSCEGKKWLWSRTETKPGFKMWIWIAL